MRMPQNVTDRPVSAEEARAEMDRVLHSPTFQRAERLQKFLQFVCERTLNGESSRINEYLIGSEVFQRGPDYSPNEDSIVRRQAHALRRDSESGRWLALGHLLRGEFPAVLHALRAGSS